MNLVLWHKNPCIFLSATIFSWKFVGMCQKVCLLKINHWPFPQDLWTCTNQGQVRHSFCLRSCMTILQLLITQKGQLVWSWFLFYLKAIEWKIFLVSGNLCLFAYSICFLSFKVTRGFWLIINMCTGASCSNTFYSQLLFICLTWCMFLIVSWR